MMLGINVKKAYTSVIFPKINSRKNSIYNLLFQLLKKVLKKVIIYYLHQATLSKKFFLCSYIISPTILKLYHDRLFIVYMQRSPLQSRFTNFTIPFYDLFLTKICPKVDFFLT